jgi:hypothetical protein
MYLNLVDRMLVSWELDAMAQVMLVQPLPIHLNAPDECVGGAP